MSIDYVKHLQRQLGFIGRSCQLYDQGFEDEAIRVATTIRVLIHDTRNSTSLLQHLDKKNISVLSQSSSLILGGETFFLNMGIIQSGKFVPNFNGGPLNKQIPLDNWWNQIAFILDDSLRLTKRDIVLVASNKDGGTHVDSSIPAAYEELIKFGNEPTITTPQGNTYDGAKTVNAHFTALRQMGHELLNSPELIGICNKA
ncbi:hypothetical protein [Porticoccus sp.]